MKINEIFEKKKLVISAEIFPPKKDSAIDTVINTIESMKDKSLDFVSVTYGAGGSNNRNSTVAIASKLKNQYHFEPLAHLVCINSTKQSVQEILKELKANNIENIMALRGDKNPEIENISDFQYASDLIKLINQYGGFNLSAACYPEGHNEASSLQADIDNLKNKVDCGVSNLITQLFFDNESFYEFSDLAAQNGINIPIST
ncbi:MAG: methylenetetrahydrofolate reductase, partial [Clostridia bacterium]